jgi:hypothetical protein
MSSTGGHFEGLFGTLPTRPDRRAYARTNSALLTYVELGGGNGGIALNLSEGGLAITSAELLMSDYLPSVRFQLPRSDVWIEASGKVAWTSDSRKDAGVQFIDLADSDREKIRQWIATKDSTSGSVQGTSETVRGTDMEFRGIRSASKFPMRKRKLEVLSEADEAKFASMFPSEKSLTNVRESETLTQDAEPRIAEQNSRDVLQFSEQVLKRTERTGTSKGIERVADETTQAETALPLSNDSHSVEKQTSRPSDFLEENSLPVSCVDASCEGEQPRAGGSELAQPESAKAELPHSNSAESESPQPVDLPKENPLVATRVEESLEEKVAYQQQPEVPAHVFLQETDLIQQLELHKRNQAAKLLSDQEREVLVERRSGWPLAALVLLIGMMCFAVGIGVGNGFFDKLLGRDQELEQRSDAKPANLPAATAGENDFAGGSAVAGNAQKSAEASPGNSAAAPPNNMADRAVSDSPADSEAKVPVQAAPTGAANTNSGDGGNSAAKDQKQAGNSVPATTSSRNSAADVPRDTSGNSSGNSLSSDAPTSDLANERRATPESSTRQNLGAPIAPVTKPQQAETSVISPGAAVATQTVQPFSETQGPILVTAPDEKSGPFRLTLAEQAVSASPTLAISAERSVSIPAQPGPASAHRAERLQVGVLIFHVDPQVPSAGNQKEMAGTVKVRATIGKSGDVIDVKPMSGPVALIPAVVQAVREWRYTVTLLDGQPLGTEEDVVVAFRPRS